jgi:hypothetical protein
MNKVGQVFLRVLRIFPVSVIPPWLSVLLYILEDEQYALWWSQFRDMVSPHDMNNNKNKIQCILVILGLYAGFNVGNVLKTSVQKLKNEYFMSV